MVLANDFIVVWTPLSKEFCVIFQNVTTHKSRFKRINNPKLLSMELAKIWYKLALKVLDQS